MLGRTNTILSRGNILTCATGWLAYMVISSCNVAAADGSEPQSATGLKVHGDGNDITLAWPSNPRESFAVLWRTNIADQTPWAILTNLLHASPQTNLTVFRDVGKLAQMQPPTGDTNAADLYRILVVPDFWFDLKAAELGGGPKNLGEDFLPFYYGSKETGILKPSIELLVDGKPAGIGGTVDEDIQRVNFGTQKTPQWIYAAGFWFDHGSLPSGKHTLQLLASIRLNQFVGDLSQSVSVTNEPVRIRISGNNRTRDNWWCRRLGREFVRKHPTPEDSQRNFINGGANPLESKILARPIELLPAHTEGQ